MNKKILIGTGLVIAALGFLFYGCGQQATTNGGTTIDYTIQGKVGGVTGASVKAAAASTVTNIVAIGINNEKYLATYATSEGTFSIGITKGLPYVIGFYNKSGGQITLLGYLRQTEVDWDSLPIIEPSGDSTDLGTVEIDATSVEAIPSIALNSLISDMNMDLSTAQYYGEVDDTLAVLSNLDVDGNGEFDFEEDKQYFLETYVSMGLSISPIPGQIEKMLADYNDDYQPRPIAYDLVMSGTSSHANGAAVSITHPQPVTSYNGITLQTVSTSIEVDASGYWSFAGSPNDEMTTTPEVAPAGTYVATIETTTYTIRNFKASDIVSVGAVSGIIYPVFHLATNEAGYITRVDYKWQKVEEGTIGAASAEELKATVLGSYPDESYRPVISFFKAEQDPSATGIPLDRDGSSVDVSSYDVKLSDIHHIQAAYYLTSRVVLKFDME